MRVITRRPPKLKCHHLSDGTLSGGESAFVLLDIQ